jgi:hypothetical protein
MQYMQAVRGACMTAGIILAGDHHHFRAVITIALFLDATIADRLPSQYYRLVI